MRIADS
ncbi:Protein of unknown function, partial [Gryllus bimaculatus]